MKVASIDIGTNTIRLLIAHIQNGNFKKVFVGREITRLGGGFGRKGGAITNEAMERSIEAILKFSHIIGSHGVDRIRAVATSVVREASNGEELLNRIEGLTGIKVEVIPWDEEARLAAKGVLSSVEIEDRYVLILDIGGGSTEFVLVEDSNVVEAVSTNLGVVHLAERYLPGSGVPSQENIALLCEEIENKLRDGLRSIISYAEKGPRLVATAGTPTTLAAIDLKLDHYDPEKINGHVITRDSIYNIFKELISLSSVDRLKIVGLEKGREDLLIPGAIIVLKTMDKFRSSELTVSDGGLLEGIALSML